MNPEIDLILRIVGIAAQISIPVVIFYAGREIAKAQFMKSTQDAWNEFNKLVISNSDNVKIAKEKFSFSWVEGNEDSFRHAHIAFVAINALVIVHYGVKHKLLPKDYRDQNFDQILKPWMADDQMFELTQSRGYPVEFRKACSEIRSRHFAEIKKTPNTASQ